jgi:hypothetical protein
MFIEQEEIDELIFVVKGTYAIGFEINKKEKMILKQKEATVIGGFEFTYNKRSFYIYKSRSEINGYSIRKRGWKSIENNFPDF